MLNHRKLVLALLFLLLAFSPRRLHAYTAYTVKSDSTIQPSLAVVLESGTAGTSEISVNGTTANVTATAIINTQDYVDNNSSNVDSSDNKGTHSNFTAQQYGPDLINDTLTEENTGGSGGSGTLWLYVNADDETRTDWTRVGTNPYLNATDYPTNFVNVSGNSLLIGDFNFTDSGKSAESIATVEVQLYAKQTDPRNLEVFVWDGSSWATLGSLAISTSWGWINWTATTTLDTWTKIDGAKMYIATKSATGTFEVDCARLKVDYIVTNNFELDLEVRWIDLDFGKPNEELCIYGGSMGTENIKVDVWNGTGWENLLTDLNSGWNNVSISSHLTSDSFNIRFKGGNETSDTNQDTWDIDVSLIHVWNVTANYELDLEVQWTSVDYTKTNEELCIRTGTFSGSENIQVKVWNTTGSSWHWVMNLTASQWSNVSITSYLTSSTFTVQFLGGTEVGDTAQDSWNIDATLLHVWTNGSTYDHVLKVVSKKAYHQNIRLILYDNSSIGRLSNCTVWFYNATASSVQVKIIDGSNVQSTGDWFNLTASGDRPIAVYAEESSSGTSVLYLRLEAVKGNSIIYTCLIKLTVN